MEVRTDARTHYEAVLEVRYGMRVGLMHRRLFSHINAAFTAVSLLGGSSAFAGVMSGSPQLTAWAGVVLAVVAVLSHVINPAVAAYRAELGRKQFAALDREASRLSLEELDSRLRAIRESDLPDIEALRVPAHNCVLRENGRPDAVLPETRWNRLVVMFA